MASHEKFVAPRHFWSFTAKQRHSVLLKDWSRWGLLCNCKNVKKTNKKWLHTAHLEQTLVYRSPEISNWFEKTLFTPSTYGGAGAPTSGEFHPDASVELICSIAATVSLSLQMGVNNVVINQCGISWLPETWITPEELVSTRAVSLSSSEKLAYSICQLLKQLNKTHIYFPL